MTNLIEGQLRFQFAPQALAAKYDDGAFYRQQFLNGCASDNKAVDLLCVMAQQAWLIEVKDYRQHRRTKSIDLADEVATKVRDTLAGLVAAQLRASDPSEQAIARATLRAKDIRVICHLEQPRTSSRLRPKAIEPDKVKDKLRRRLKAIDPHPRVVDASSTPTHLPWQVFSI